LFIFCNPNDNFDIGVDGGVSVLADFGKALWSVLLALLTTTLVIECGGRKLTYIMMVAIHNLHVNMAIVL
jgi:hypothetical protein